MADRGLPASPGSGKGSGWYPVGGVNDQAHWDGERWTGRRRWTGASWTEVPLEGGSGSGAASAPPAGAGSSRRWFVIGLLVLVVAIGLAAGLVYATSSSSNRANSTSPLLPRTSSLSSSPA